MKISNSKLRLKEMMDVLGLKQSDIVQKTGVNKSSLSNYLSGRRIPTQDQLSLIADPYKINPAWLMGYDVPMEASVMSNDGKKTKATELYSLYEQASPEVQSAVELLLRSAQHAPESQPKN